MCDNLNIHTLIPTKTVDARGTTFPGPLAEVMQSMGTYAAGDITEILCTDTGHKGDLPKWCKEQGHEYLGTIEENGYFKIYLRSIKIDRST